MNRPQVPAGVVAYVRGLDARLREVVGDSLIASYLHGSAALGGFVERRSDVDVLFIADVAWDDHVLGEAVSALRSAAPNCPGRGVELSVVTAEGARRPAPPWPFVLHMTTEPADSKVVMGLGHPGDPDLLIHYAVCRAAGMAVSGRPPQTLIGEIDRADISAYLRDELVWAAAGRSEAYCVLNACRAWHFVVSGELVSKVEGARLALERGGPVELIQLSLSMQLGDEADRPPSEAAKAFAGEIRGLLRAGSP